MIRDFYRNEIFKFKNLFNPILIFKILYKYRYVHFFLTGVSGVFINLLITWFLTEFFFGLEKYFYAYCFGLSFNLVYNFILNTIVNFKTKEKHKRRFVLFVGYSLLITFVQASIVKFITPVIGLEYYLIVISVVVMGLSFFNFIIFKLWLFKENFVKTEK